MRILFLFLITTLVLFSCNSSSVTDSNSNTDTSAMADTVPSARDTSNIANTIDGCYRMIIGRDSATLNIKRTGGNIVEGTLNYNRYEKDDNTGNFVGEIKGSKIIGWYTFSSEGSISVRQVAFKILGNDLAEGYGDIASRSDTAYYKRENALDYEEGHPFMKVVCDQVTL